jgi:hypothetical protein
MPVRVSGRRLAGLRPASRMHGGRRRSGLALLPARPPPPSRSGGDESAPQPMAICYDPEML